MTRPQCLKVLGATLPWLRLSCGLYLGGVVLVWALFRAVGEAWWVSAFALYAPPVLLALPLLILLPLVLAKRRWSLLPYLLLAALVVVFPLMGFNLPASASSSATDVVFTLYTQNTHERDRSGALLAQLQALKPDIVLLQEAEEDGLGYWRAKLPGYDWRQDGPYLFASRFQVTHVQAVWRQAHIHYDALIAGRQVTLLSIHPPSPRFALYHLAGVHPETDSRAWHSMTAIEVLEHDAGRRVGALRGIAEAAQAIDGPVIVAGDSNVPHSSWALATTLGDLTDAFHQAGFGFGYTFPSSPFSWLRLDRVLVSNAVAVHSASVVGAADSDHRGLIVTLALKADSPATAASSVRSSR